MLNYNSVSTTPFRKPTPNFNSQATQLANAFNYLADKKEKQEALDEKQRQELLAVQASDITQRYKLQKLDIINNQELSPNEQLQALQELGQAHLSQLEEISGDSKEVYNAYKYIQLDNKDSLYRLRDYHQKIIKNEQKKDFVSKLTLGGFKSLEDAREYNKTMKLGFSEKDLVKGFEEAGTRRALEYIQASTVDGMPTELLKFNTRGDVIKAFYPELGKDAKIPQSIISAIAQAHKWQIQETRRKQSKANDSQSINLLINRINREVRRANVNGIGVDRSIANTLNILNGLASTPTQKDKLQNLANKVSDNQNIMAVITQGLNQGMSKQEMINKLKTYISISDTDKMALINKAFDRGLAMAEDAITSSLAQGDVNSAGQAFERLYSLDIDEGSKVAGRIIKKELSQLNPSSLNSTINALELYISSEQNAGNPIPLEEQRLLNELKGVAALGAKGESSKDIAKFLQAKKIDYLERKRTRHLKNLNTKEQIIREGLKDEWLEFDNETTQKEIRNFLIHNPDIPANRVYDAYIKQTTDIDTTDIPLVEDFGKYNLAENIRNGKLLIPDDRELGNKSLSAHLKAWIPKHSDDFTHFVLNKVNSNTKGIKHIEDTYFIFNKIPNGELQIQVYGTPKGSFNEELLGIINHNEIEKYLNNKF